MSNPMLSQKARFEQICPTCREPTDLVDDHATGDLVCTECGTVMESHVIDEAPEWRSFDDPDKGGGNKERAGGPNNNLLADGGVGSTIGMAPGARTRVNQLTRTHQQRGGDSHKALKRAFRELRTMCERLGVPEVVYDRSCEIFRDIHDVGIKGRKPSAVYAACIFVACRQEKIPRTFKEITPVAQDTNKVEIWRVFNAIKDKLKISQAKLGVISTTSFVERWSSTLKLGPDAKKAAKEIATIACPNAAHSRKWDTRTHTSVTAAALLLVARAGGIALDLAEVARRTGVAVGTIKDVYEELCTEAASLVPVWFVDPAVLEKRLGLSKGAKLKGQGQGPSSE